MKRILLTCLFACSLVLSAFSMSGCNTFRGMAHDSRESIDALQVGPNEAYHQDARDF